MDNKNKQLVKDAAKKAYDLMAEIKRDEHGNPVTLEGVIKSLILKSPDYTTWRDRALNILYCVLGSGIDWNEYGRLGDCYPNNYMNMPPNVGGQGIWSRDFGLSDSLKQMSEGLGEKSKEIFKIAEKKIIQDQEKKLLEAVKTVNEIDYRCKTYNNKITNWYSVSWFACHLCVPGNAQRDFIDGAIETAKLILKTNQPQHTDKWIKLQKNKGYAEEILYILEHVHNN